MKKLAKVLAAVLAAACVVSVVPTTVSAMEPSRPTVGTTIQNVDFAYNPGVIILPYGAMLSKNGSGWVLAFLDGSVAALKNGTKNTRLMNGFLVSMNNNTIVYSKMIDLDPVTVTYNLNNCIATAVAGNVTANYINGSILSSKITNYGAYYCVETYGPNCVILKNETFDAASKRLLAVDDYVRTPGMIVRTEYDAAGNPISMLPYYGDTRPAY